MTITQKDITEIEKKLKDKIAHRKLIAEYKSKRFEFNHPILFKLKNFFNKGEKL